MNKYELTVLYHPDLEIDIDKALAKVEKIIKDNNGKVEKTDNWGKRKLAYTISKQDHAVYVYYEVEIPGENVTKLENILNITDEIIRYLLVKPGPEIKEEAPSEDKAEDKPAEVASEEAPAEDK